MKKTTPSRDLWILNGTLVTQDSNRRILNAHLQVIDGRISKITKTKPKRLSRNSQIIDAKNLLVLPGFIQTHIHLCQTLFKNQADDLELLDWLSKRIWVMEAKHTEQTINTSAWMGIYELLASGTTCILDMATVRHTEAVLEAVQESGIRASVGKCLMDHPDAYSGLRESTKESIKEAIRIFETWNGRDNDRIRVSYAPRFAISCTEKLLRHVAELSKSQTALVHTHASENKKEIELVRKMFGCENIEYLERVGITSELLVLAHGIWLNDQEISILKKTKTNITHCPSSNLKLASGIAPIPKLRSQGIRVCLGADGAPCNNNLNMFEEMRLAALIQKPIHGPRCMKAQEVFDMATREGAQALQWFDDIGSIEEGKKADLFGLDLNCPENVAPMYTLGKELNPDPIVSSIVYSSQPKQVRWSIVDGRIVFEKNQLRSLSFEKLMNRIHKAQRHFQ